MDYKKIAELLILATKDVVIKDKEDWLNENHKGAYLRYRVGTGQRTYFSSKRGSNVGTITFGVKMIKKCLSSRLVSTYWTHGKEIVNRGYFNGVVTPQSILAAVILHEVAHYFQKLIFGIADGSIHNKDFYRILDKMNFNGTAEKVTNYLMEFELFKNLEFAKSDSVEGFILGRYTKNDLNKGDAFYYLNSKNEESFDIISSLNPSRISTEMGFLIQYQRVIRVANDEENEKRKMDILKIKNKLKELSIGDTIEVKNFNRKLVVEKINRKTVLAITTNGERYKIQKFAIIQ